LATGALLDVPSTRQLEREITARIGGGDLQAIGADLALKSVSFGELLLDAPARPGRGELHQVLRSVFAARRRADALLDAVGPEALGAAVAMLLDPGESIAGRIDRFEESVSGRLHSPDLAHACFDLAGELLHFSDPDRYWLWTRWIWDPDTGTGTLGLLTGADLDLSAASTKGAAYLEIGRVMALLDETRSSAGIGSWGSGTLGLDVLLAGAYGLYMHTLLETRMTREFNRVIPPLGELVRRLLGVHRRGA
jgi:hypothetical protein